MKKIIKLTESDLHEIIKSVVNKIIKEDIGPIHHGHNLDDFLDDRDFITIANRVEEKYGNEYFAELYFSHDDEWYDEVEGEIAEIVKDFVDEEATHAFGYKYGTCNYRTVASNILEYLKHELKHLYK